MSTCCSYPPTHAHLNPEGPPPWPQVTNLNKREYVLLKAHKMLVGAIEGQTTAIIDAFHSIIPRDLIDKYSFTALEMQLLVCGEQRIDISDLRRHCKWVGGGGQGGGSTVVAGCMARQVQCESVIHVITVLFLRQNWSANLYRIMIHD